MFCGEHDLKIKVLSLTESLPNSINDFANTDMFFIIFVGIIIGTSSFKCNEIVSITPVLGHFKVFIFKY